MAIVSALLIVLNEGLGLNVDSEVVLAFAGIVASYIIGQAHVDAKKEVKKNDQPIIPIEPPV